jgi:hypothetical protein
MKESELLKLFKKYIDKVGMKHAAYELGYCKGYIEIMYYGCRTLPDSVVEFLGYERRTVIFKKKVL